MSMVNILSQINHLDQPELQEDTQIKALTTENVKLKERNQHLDKEIIGLETEVLQLRNVIFTNNVVYDELETSFSALQKMTDRKDKDFESQLLQQQHRIQQLKSDNSKFLPPKVMKAYHDLGPSQKTKVNRQFNNTFAPEVNEYLRKRKLTLGHVILEDVEGFLSDWAHELIYQILTE
jgi:predicted  nucleic acid-binding Zn-ribbon protein